MTNRLSGLPSAHATTHCERAMSLRAVALSVLLLSHAVAAFAQTGALPPTSRTVYKCLGDGKASYSDSPCLGAQLVDVTPTRGLDKMSGHKRMGHDVSTETHREAMARALKPLTGMDAAELKVEQRRQQLPASARLECSELDSKITRAETLERSANGDSLQAMQNELFAARRRFRVLGC